MIIEYAITNAPCERCAAHRPTGRYCKKCNYPADPLPVEKPFKLYAELQTTNRGFCMPCATPGVMHKTAIICPHCRAMLGGF